MTPRFLMLSLALVASFSGVARASDLSDDLKTPFTDQSNPFTTTSPIALPAGVIAELKTVLDRCAYSPVVYRKDGSVAEQDEAKVRRACRDELKTSSASGGEDDLDRLDVKLPDHTTLTVVAWDGSDSDGGDEQAIGVYDATGKRVAVYPAEHVIGDVVDGIAYSTGIELTAVKALHRHSKAAN